MISVILPVYNGEKFILTAIDCVRRQRYTDWELIVVNDGSTDSTPALLDRFSGDPKIRVIHQKNGGVSAARNTAIAAARGSHVAMLDADDLWHEDHLEVMAELIGQYPQAALFGTYAELQLVNGERIRNCAYFEGKPEVICSENFFSLYAEDKRAKMFNVSSCCIRKDALDACGRFREGCRIGEDLALFLKLAAYYPVVLCGRVTAVYMKFNSVATKDVSFDPDWYFFEEVQELLRDPVIPEAKKVNIRRVMDWFQMRRSRHYMIDGRRREAREAYRRISNSEELKKDKWLTWVLLWLPCGLVKKIFVIRWRGQA